MAERSSLKYPPGRNDNYAKNKKNKVKLGVCRIRKLQDLGHGYETLGTGCLIFAPKLAVIQNPPWSNHYFLVTSKQVISNTDWDSNNRGNDTYIAEFKREKRLFKSEIRKVKLNKDFVDFFFEFPNGLTLFALNRKKISHRHFGHCTCSLVSEDRPFHVYENGSSEDLSGDLGLCRMIQENVDPFITTCYKLKGFKGDELERGQFLLAEYAVQSEQEDAIVSVNDLCKDRYLKQNGAAILKTVNEEIYFRGVLTFTRANANGTDAVVPAFLISNMQVTADSVVQTTASSSASAAANSSATVGSVGKISQPSEQPVTTPSSAMASVSAATSLSTTATTPRETPEEKPALKLNPTLISHQPEDQRDSPKPCEEDRYAIYRDLRADGEKMLASRRKQDPETKYQTKTILPPRHNRVSREDQPSTAPVSSVSSTEISVKVNLRIQAAGHLQQVTDIIIQKYENDPQSLKRLLLNFVLPHGTTLSNLLEGCIVLVIQATSMTSLEKLWDKYESGNLKDALQQVLITQEVKDLVNYQDIELDLEIKKEHYETALKRLQEVLMQDVPLQNVVNNPALMDEMAMCLDKEFVFIKYWKHLVHYLGVPSSVSRQFEIYTSHSPTVKLFQYLQVDMPELTVLELKQALEKDYRNDVVKILKQKCQDKGFVASQVTDNTSVLEKVALELDTGVMPLGNWRSLARKLGVRLNKIHQFEMYSDQNPTAMLFMYLSTFQKDLKVQTLKDCLGSMGRNDALGVLTKFRLNDSDLVGSVIVPDSNVSDELEDLLNRTTVGVKNWRKLAYQLDVPHSEYNGWDLARRKAWRSPTKLLLEWLRTYKQDLRLDVLAEALQNIGRNDAFEILTRFIPNILEPSGTVVRSGTEVMAGAQRAEVSDVTDSPSSQPRQETLTQHTPPYTPPATAEERMVLKVSLIPLSVYSKVCMKLDVRRISYDDYRMLGEKCGVDRDVIEYLEQRGDPTNEILKKWTGRVGNQANVGAFIEILKDIERVDVAEILEEWVRS